MDNFPKPSRWRSRTTVLLALLILIPSCWGFAGKFAEFISTFEKEADGQFALTPIVNYTLASVGFFLLFIWAAANGMFRNIEDPKYKMLENEHLLDHPRKKKP